MKSIDERILYLESLFPWCDGVQGTTITRVLTAKEGQKWSLGLGAAYKPKIFYTADTIEELLNLAEENIENDIMDMWGVKI